MNAKSKDPVNKIIEEVYRKEGRKVFATLVRLLGDFDLAEELLHEAFAAAVEQWERDGIPSNPGAWLVSAGKFKAIDALRRRQRLEKSMSDLNRQIEEKEEDKVAWSEEMLKDDQLRLIFTCCHPALQPATQIALTLREVCGLKTEEIAAAFVTGVPTIAQRIVRGKNKIRDAKIPYVVPEHAELPERLDSVLSVIYLVFNEGYSASSGASLIRKDLCAEAIRLARNLLQLLPDAEVMGLLALMLLNESRHEARESADGDLVLHEDQDRSLWKADVIREGVDLVQRAIATRDFGSYTLQAAIAAVHAEARTPAETDWPQIVALYDLLLTAMPSPIVELNRAVGIAMRDGPEAGLRVIDALLAEGGLDAYHLPHAARADMYRRLGEKEKARHSYEQALLLAKQEPERRFLSKRLKELE